MVGVVGIVIIHRELGKIGIIKLLSILNIVEFDGVILRVKIVGLC